MSQRDRKYFALVIAIALSVLLLPSDSWATRSSSKAKSDQKDPIARTRYQINLKLDFDALSYSGTERVRWINQGDHSTSVLYFHLYSNVRVDPQLLGLSANTPAPEADEPQVEVTEVRSTSSNLPLNFSLDDQGTTLRINLREPVSSGGATEVSIVFKGTVPEIDPDETGLTTHVVKQVSAAIRGEREVRRARDINFRCRGVMLLGTSYPVLAVHDGDDWKRKLEPSVGDIVFNEAADYDVTLEAAPTVAVFGSGSEVNAGAEVHHFSAPASRDFAIVAGRNLRFEQTQVGDTTLRSIFFAEHERIGKRVLGFATDALRIFTTRFGQLPFKSLSIAEVPLVAGLGSTEFAGINVIASAFYVDFESQAMRNLPEIIREQRPAVEQSLEWSVAHLVAHQWWGAAVGNDPSREPVLDEALACWSALLYYKETYGEEQARGVLQDQLLGVYRVYRTFGGEDMDANRPSKDYRNSFQYAAIVTTKGALMFVDLQRLLGSEKFLAGLRGYYEANLLEIAEMDDLRSALVAETPIEQRRLVGRTMSRWLSSKRGDEDIARPDQELATSLGLPARPGPQKSEGNPFTAFARVGKFFWQQMTRIR